MTASTEHGYEHLHLPVGSDCYELSHFGKTKRSKAKSKVLAGWKNRGTVYFWTY